MENIHNAPATDGEHTQYTCYSYRTYIMYLLQLENIHNAPATAREHT